ncbi:MAG: ornithine--oxo-acid transaminase [Betaproteobacteria bacterium]
MPPHRSAGPGPDAAPFSAAAAIRQETRHGARNYDPLPVVLARGEGCWLEDVDGRRYLDMMSAYSAVSHGHAHPRLVATLVAQARRLAVTSRAFHNDRLPPFLARLTEVTGLDRALPVNTGLEAVETALKAARKWGHKVKGIPDDRAEIVACRGNFHGRSIAITGLSSEPQYRDGFGPFPPATKLVPFGDIDALARSLGPHTAAFLVEPIQGEAGIVLPPAGYLAACAQLCRERRVLFIVDEIQTGMGRTGRFLAVEHDGVRPDGVILGKALGGGLLPVSAFVATDDVMQVFTPGDHGSTFGGNPLAAAVGLAAIDVLFDEGLIERSATLGAQFTAALAAIESPLIRDVRGRGLFIGLEVDRTRIDARAVVDRLLARGILSRDTHGTVVRFAPPLVIDREALDWAAGEVRAVFAELDDGLRLPRSEPAAGAILT